MNKIKKKNSRLLYILGFSYFVLVATYFITDGFTAFSKYKIDLSFVNVFFNSSSDYCVVTTSSVNLPTTQWNTSSGFNSSSGSGNSYEYKPKFKTKSLNYNLKNNNQEINSNEENPEFINFSDGMQSESYNHMNNDYSNNSGSNTPGLALDGNVKGMLSNVFRDRNTTEKVKYSLNSDLLIAENTISSNNSESNNYQKTGVDPEGDPTGDVIPVGDGMMFLMVMAIIYAVLRCYTIRTENV